MSVLVVLMAVLAGVEVMDRLRRWYRLVDRTCHGVSGRMDRAGAAARVTLAALSAIGLVSPATAIVNGAPPSGARYAEEFGWAVALVHPASGGVCTAQLVSPTWVLTAAHCTGLGMQLLMGNPTRAEATALAPAEAIKHPRYDRETGEYDIGLIRLQAPVTQAPVRVVTRQEAVALLKPDARAVIAGWGKRSPQLPFSERFIVSDVELRSLSIEKTRFAYYDPVSGPCGGDSGGPLLLERAKGEWVLAGIASRVVGDLCAQGGGIGIYVHVAAMRDFIERHVKDLPRD
jgi:hypothetical protein